MITASLAVFKTAILNHLTRSGTRRFLMECCRFLSQLIRRFEVRPDPDGAEVKPITRTLLCPATPINLQFQDRGARRAPGPAAGASL